MSEARRPFTNVGHAETVTRSFNFAPGLAHGETLVGGSATCELEVITGTDASVADRLIAGPTIIGATVSVLIGDLVDGVTYRVRADVGTSGGQLLSCWTTQKCVGP